MVGPRDYPHIDEFLGEPGRRADTIEENMRIMSEQELKDLNSALEYVEPHDPTRDWKNEMYNGRLTDAFAEIVLCWHFRQELGRETVTINAEYTETGKDFDLLVEWNDRDYWIDVRVPEGVLGEALSKGGGWISGEGTGSSIDNKLENQFQLARETLPDNAILVLAVYLNATLLDQLLLGRHLHDVGEDDHPGHYCDAFIEYYHRESRPVIDVRELTDRGRYVTELRKQLPLHQ